MAVFTALEAALAPLTLTLRGGRAVAGLMAVLAALEPAPPTVAILLGTGGAEKLVSSAIIEPAVGSCKK